MENIINSIARDPILIYLPILIIVHLIIGIITAIKTKTFKFKELPNFIFKGTLIIVFMVLVNSAKAVVENNALGDVAVAGITGLWGTAWLAVLLYYLAAIYKNLVTLGCPKLPILEKKLEESNTEAEESNMETTDSEHIN